MFFFFYMGRCLDLISLLGLLKHINVELHFPQRFLNIRFLSRPPSKSLRENPCWFEEPKIRRCLGPRCLAHPTSDLRGVAVLPAPAPQLRIKAAGVFVVEKVKGGNVSQRSESCLFVCLESCGYFLFAVAL